MRNKVFIFAIGLTLVFSSISGMFGEILEGRYVGGKVVGKGGAINADSMGVSSIFFNSAALADVKKNLEIWFSYGAPYEDVPGSSMHEFAFAAGYNLGFMKTAVGFKSTGDFTALSYNYIYATGATSFEIGNSILKSVSVGLSLKMVDIHAGNLPSYTGFSVNSDGIGFSFDVGTQLHLFSDVLVLGINGRNLFSSSISLIGTGGDSLKRDLFLGLKCYITKFLNLTVDYNALGSAHTVPYINLFGDSVSFANLYFGIEFDYLENMEIYTGFNEGSLTLGVGVTDSDYFKLDFGIWVLPGLKMYSHVGLSVSPF